MSVIAVSMQRFSKKRHVCRKFDTKIYIQQNLLIYCLSHSVHFRALVFKTSKKKIKTRLFNGVERFRHRVG